MSTSKFDRLRRPEYTGENRCTPCTAANVVLAGALSLVVGYGWAVAVGSFAWPLGGLVFATSLASIWLRGYLLPGTPELTKRYFPDWLLRRFDKEPDPPSRPGGLDAAADNPHTGESAANGSETAQTDNVGDGVEPPEETDAETLLLSAGVVEPCEQEDDLCLGEGFDAAWHEQMRAIRDEETERDELARELDLDAADIEFDEHGDAFVAHTDSRRVGQWESRAALVADLAAARELPEWVDGWEAMPVGARSQLLGGLRIFLDACPVCEGHVAAGMETVESCCRSHEVVAANCDDCDARLVEMQYLEPA